MKANAETNSLYLRRLEQASTLAPGSAAALIRSFTTSKEREIDQRPSAFVGTVVGFLLGSRTLNPDLADGQPASDGKRFLTAEAEAATSRGGGLSRARPFLAPYLSYHNGGKFVDGLADELEILEPHSAASVAALKLTTDRECRDACHADFRPELPSGERRVAEVLDWLKSEYNVTVADAEALATKWGGELARNAGPIPKLAEAMIARLTNQDARLLASNSGKVPSFDNRFWEAVEGDWKRREREAAGRAAQQERDARTPAEVEAEAKVASARDDLMSNPEYAQLAGI